MGKIILKTKKKAVVEHEYDLVMSVTRFELDGEGACETTTMVTAYRQESDLGPHLLSNLDIKEAVMGKVHYADVRAIAMAIIALPRMRRVEAIECFSGAGIVIEKDED
jgi:hypothetical protein